jgi:serine/threonine protein kinase
MSRGHRGTIDGTGQRTYGPVDVKHGKDVTANLRSGEREETGSADAESPAEILGGRYRLGRQLGQGGMGEVFEGTDLELRRQVAVKRIAKGQAFLRELRDRFFDEVDAVTRAEVGGRHAVRIFDKGLDASGHPYFVMELVRGITLKDALAEGPLDVPRALRLVEDLLCGVEAAHMVGVIHRDLKPSNVMVVREASGDEAVRILDFGIAKAVDAQHGSTQENVVVGTPGYLAPEVAAGSRTVHPRIDVHAVGVILFELLAGRSPWQAESPSSVLREQVANSRRPRLLEARPTVPVWVDDLVARAMESDPLRRYQGAGEMLRALRAGLRPQAANELDVERLAPGDVILDGAYEIVRLLGEGGMALVYEAKHRHLGRHDALKFLRPNLLAATQVVARFVKDGRLAAGIDHPGVVRVYDAREGNGHPYIALELVRGRTWAEFAATASLEQLAHAAAQVGAALDEIHRRGVIHRDVTPENVVVDASGRTRIIDFGIARDEQSTLTRTSTASQLGRYGYMAPEQAEGAKLTGAADQWSLAAMVYEALVGLPPHKRADDDPEDFDRFFSRLVGGDTPLPSPSDTRPEVPLAVSAVVMRGLAQEPAARFPSAGELGRALVSAVSQAGATKPKRRSGVWLAGVAVLLAAAGTGWQLVGRAERVQASSAPLFGPADATPSPAVPSVPTARPDTGSPTVEAPEPRAEASVPRRVKVRLVAKQSGATAEIDGVVKELPLELEGEPGSERVATVKRRGYRTEVVHVRFEQAGDLPVDLHRERRAVSSTGQEPVEEEQESPYAAPSNGREPE